MWGGRYFGEAGEDAGVVGGGVDDEFLGFDLEFDVFGGVVEVEG